MNYKILVIDDEKVVCKAIKKELEDEGYKVEWALNGRDGVKMVIEDGFEAAIIDLILPDINGVEVCKQIRTEKPKIKTILMSGNPGKLDACKEAFRAVGGCNHFINKPFDQKELSNLAKEIFAP